MGSSSFRATLVERRWILLSVALLAAGCRLLYWFLVTPGYTPDSDAAQYQLLAENIASGRGYSLVFPGMALHPTAFRPPLYPLLLAGT